MVRGDFIDCPKSAPCDFGHWYKFAHADGLDACSACYTAHIAHTRLAQAFKERPGLEHESSFICDFDIPRVKALWRDCVARGSVDSLVSYTARRTTVIPCAGPTAVELTDDRKIYGLVNNEIDDFGICGACYEDFFVSNGMAHRFVERGPAYRASLGKNVSFICDGATRTTRSAARAYQDRDWQTFIGWVRGRRAAPDCAGLGGAVPDNRRGWTLAGVDDFAACEACHLDHIAFSSFRPHFQPNTKLHPGTWTCDLAHPLLKSAFDVCVERNNIKLFHNAAQTVLQASACTEGGIEDGLWFVLKGSESDENAFKMCAVCYACIVLPDGAGDKFSPRRFPAGTAQKCDLRLTDKNPRVFPTLMRLARAMGTQDWEYFDSYAKTVAIIPPCPRDTRVGGSRYKWYGTSSWAACAECHQEVVVGSSLEHLLPIKGEALPESRVHWCELYSPRMRRLYARACETHDVSELETAALQRTQVHAQVQMMMQVQNMQMGEQIRQKNRMLLNASMLRGADLIASSVGDSGYRYGNSSTGWFQTHAGAEGAALYNQASSMRTDVPNFSGALGMWHSVE